MSVRPATLFQIISKKVHRATHPRPPPDPPEPRGTSLLPDVLLGPDFAGAFAPAVVDDKTAGHRIVLSICLAYAKEGA